MASLVRLRRLPKVAEISDERDMGNGLIATMAKGWSFDPFQDNRVAGADNAHDAEVLIKSATPYFGPYDE